MKKALRTFKDSLQQVLYTADISQIADYEIPLPNYPGSITKKFYQALINFKAQPANLSRWANILNIGNTEELRHTVFRRKVVDVKENKIKENVNANCQICQKRITYN